MKSGLKMKNNLDIAYCVTEDDRRSINFRNFNFESENIYNYKLNSN